jgi:hypothetical protein
MSSVYKEYAASLAEYVFHPDYYKGRWYIHVRNHGSRLCRNYETATAWSKYLARNYPDYYCWFQRADPLPGFPKNLSI